MFNLWVNAVPVLLHRKTAVANLILFFSPSIPSASIAAVMEYALSGHAAQPCMLPTPVSKLPLIL